MILNLAIKCIIKFKLFKLRLTILVAQFLMKRGIVPKALANQFAPNPLLQYPRNENCWCGSYKKSKHCCLPRQAPVMPIEQVKFLEGFMRQVEIMKKSERAGIIS